MDVRSTQPHALAVLPDFRFDCRSKEDTSILGRTLKYPLDDIVSKGVVGNNLCGKVTVAPVPGVLILFVRPRTFKEKFEL